MTQYRVGAAGATVFNEKGEALATLRPGTVVVEGKLSDEASQASQYKRQKGYADKRVRPPEDKSL